jgi:glycerol-3-phosphate dehydrogenase
MRRDVTPFATEIYDVIVVGGGIHGACAAWEAARRGLKVVLVEAGDFNAATSANSLRTLHGGLRHLQRLDFQQMRLSIRQRREWLRLAPELTRPLRFVLPLSGRGAMRPRVVRAALWVNDLFSADRNEAVRQDHHLPGGSMLTRNEFAQLFPGLSVTDFDVAAAWYDGICLDTERLQLAVIAAAVACGAQVANYVRALWPLRDGVKICGARVSDELTGIGMDLRAPVVINAAGPAIEAWLPRAQSPLFKASKAFNLLVRRLPFHAALGLRMGSGTYFVIPWNDYSIVGTRHLHGDRPEVSRAEVFEFLAQLNPLLGLTIDDVCGVFSGLLPAEAAGRDVALERAPRIVDHTRQGLHGLYSIVGVKWTTALSVGEAAASRACQQLGRSKRPVRERALEISGAVAATGGDAARVVPDLPVVFGQIAHAVREEMAVHLWDVVRRRTPLYLSRSLDHSALAACASVMARELRWSPRTTAAEIDTTEAELAAFKGPLRVASRPVAA